MTYDFELPQTFNLSGFNGFSAKAYETEFQVTDLAMIITRALVEQMSVKSTLQTPVR